MQFLYLGFDAGNINNQETSLPVLPRARPLCSATERSQTSLTNHAFRSHRSRRVANCSLFSFCRLVGRTADSKALVLMNLPSLFIPSQRVSHQSTWQERHQTETSVYAHSPLNGSQNPRLHQRPHVVGIL